MSPTAWESSYETGISEIDTQHRGLFRILADLEVRLKIAGSAELRGNREIRGQLDRLAEYVLQHFHYEEGLMESVSYPGLAEHRREHGKFEEIIMNTISRFEKETDPQEIRAMLEKLVNFLNGWLTGHIRETDRQYLTLLGYKKSKFNRN